MSIFEDKYSERTVVHFLKRGLWTGFLGGFAIGGIVTAALYTNMFTKDYGECLQQPNRPTHIQKSSQKSGDNIKNSKLTAC